MMTTNSIPFYQLREKVLTEITLVRLAFILMVQGMQATRGQRMQESAKGLVKQQSKQIPANNIFHRLTYRTGKMLCRMIGLTN